MAVVSEVAALGQLSTTWADMLGLKTKLFTYNAALGRTKEVRLRLQEEGTCWEQKISGLGIDGEDVALMHKILSERKQLLEELKETVNLWLVTVACDCSKVHVMPYVFHRVDIAHDIFTSSDACTLTHWLWQERKHKSFVVGFNIFLMDSSLLMKNEVLDLDLIHKLKKLPGSKAVVNSLLSSLQKVTLR